MKSRKQPKQRAKKRTFPKYFSEQVARGPSPVSAFPKEQTVKFKYVQIISFSSAGGTQSAWSFRLNSCFDPDYTSTGHQPFQFDQMMSVYNKYRVLKTKYKWTAVQRNSTATVPVVQCAYVSNINAPVSTVQEAMEQPYTKYGYLGPTGGSNTVNSLSCSYNIANVLGYSTNVDEDLSAAYSTNPTQVAFLHCIINAANLSDSYAVTGCIEFEFTTQVYDLVSPGVSLSLRAKADQAIRESSEVDSLETEVVDSQQLQQQANLIKMILKKKIDKG